ncbi:hypothetical protein AVEN_134026-1 [Araneus ventricosus]|uniref:Uncharacterized protein n=1 Tax=Araneus ventricosus TaxID=182803 RepID=A0A4Y2K4H3_ARAVE|nr:hypothetical protein AVEN_134026-1 [Araneus ventricosus]
MWSKCELLIVSQPCLSSETKLKNNLLHYVSARVLVLVARCVEISNEQRTRQRDKNCWKDGDSSKRIRNYDKGVDLGFEKIKVKKEEIKTPRSEEKSESTARPSRKGKKVPIFRKNLPEGRVILVRE